MISKKEKETDGSASTPGTTGITLQQIQASEPAKPQEQKTFDRSILVGDWIRTDAEYQDSNFRIA